MTLRHRFAILSFVYVASLCVNLLMSGWCILTYFESAFVDVQSSFVSQSQIEAIRLDARNVANASDTVGRKELAMRLRQVIASWPDAPGAHDALILTEARAFADELEQPSGGERVADGRLEHLLGRMSAAMTAERNRLVDGARATQQRVVKILVANAAVGVALCVVGLVLVNRWVLAPVGALRDATSQLARGNFDYRIGATHRDELGDLAREVDQMSATIVDIQARLIERERLAAIGELVSHVAHNVRNPLAGIRGLAESVSSSLPQNAPEVSYQRRIIESVDRLEHWMRELEQAVAPMNLSLQPVNVSTLIQNVRNVLHPLAERHKIRIQVDIPPNMPNVPIDAFHFEQALAALLCNAIQASPTGGTVAVAAYPPDEGGYWRLDVVDKGPGIAEEIRDKVFSPYFTTRRGGTGIGLTVASRVVQAHGGAIRLQSSLQTGSRFELVMPATMDGPHGT